MCVYYTLYNEHGSVTIKNRNFSFKKQLIAFFQNRYAIGTDLPELCTTYYY